MTSFKRGDVVLVDLGYCRQGNVRSGAGRGGRIFPQWIPRLDAHG